jgi:hypothetical protein
MFQWQGFTPDSVFILYTWEQRGENSHCIIYITLYHNFVHFSVVDLLIHTYIIYINITENWFHYGIPILDNVVLYSILHIQGWKCVLFLYPQICTVSYISCWRRTLTWAVYYSQLVKVVVKSVWSMWQFGLFWEFHFWKDDIILIVHPCDWQKIVLLFQTLPKSTLVTTPLARYW